jgi:hypothetical protein
MGDAKKGNPIPADAWPATDLPRRLRDCLRQLHLAELLTDAQFRERMIRVADREAKGKYAMPPG